MGERWELQGLHMPYLVGTQMHTASTWGMWLPGVVILEYPTLNGLKAEYTPSTHHVFNQYLGKILSRIKGWCVILFGAIHHLLGWDLD